MATMNCLASGENVVEACAYHLEWSIEGSGDLRTELFEPMVLPRVEIEYCRQCRWLLRAAWMAQELLTTFEEELGGVTLVPGIGGVFVVRVDSEIIWSRKDDGRFPDITELKQRVRDKAAPGKALGHTDRKRVPAGKAEVT